MVRTPGPEFRKHALFVGLLGIIPHHTSENALLRASAVPRSGIGKHAISPLLHLCDPFKGVCGGFNQRSALRCAHDRIQRRKVSRIRGVSIP